MSAEESGSVTSKPKGGEQAQRVRGLITRVWGLFEDVVYVGLGLMLGAMAIALLATGAVEFVHNLRSGTFLTGVVQLLDRMLLVLLVVELLYTVQVSFRMHALEPEPFLLVGLIAAIRRVLLLTAEFSQVHMQAPETFKHFVIELAVLTALIVAVTVSLVLVRKRQTPPAEGP